MEKRDGCCAVDVLVSDESIWRRLMINRESSMEGNLEEIRIRTCQEGEDIHVEQRGDNVCSGPTDQRPLADRRIRSCHSIIQVIRALTFNVGMINIVFCTRIMLMGLDTQFVRLET